MSYQRHQRVESLIQKELNKIILREIEFPAGVLVTITEVVIQKDLDFATINFSVIPVQRSNEVLEMLSRAQRRLKHLLYEKIHIKPMPELRFKIDYGMEKAAEIEKKFLEMEKIEKNKKSL
jgi:ribosome-binding factor A